MPRNWAVHHAYHMPVTDHRPSSYAGVCVWLDWGQSLQFSETTKIMLEAFRDTLYKRNDQCEIERGWPAETDLQVARVICCLFTLYHILLTNYFQVAVIVLKNQHFCLQFVYTCVVVH